MASNYAQNKILQKIKDRSHFCTNILNLKTKTGLMISDPLFDARVSLPISYIKAPGVLLRDKKNPNQVKTNTKFVKSVLQSFLEKSNSSFLSQTSYRTNTLVSQRTGQSNMTDHIGPMSPEESQDMSNIVNDDIQVPAIHMTKKIMSTYGIELVVDISIKFYQQASEALKFITSEVCTFHRHFFKKIQLTQLVVCSGENAKSANFTKNVILIDESMDKEQKVLEALYKVIFDQLAINNPSLINELEENPKQEGNKLANKIGKTEESFIALMSVKNVNNLSLRYKMKKLKELLLKYYPEEMSEEWFGTRRKERKKILKVHFLF